ncbi:MAG: NUDIX domain-containing protein, partial [Candidatus Aureabacteria bacterium]|nr:NUDIX domain-containing protein [Candidatus Auribacterota bacterium]
AAAAREIAEEAGIQSEFKAYRGCVSEHLVENGSVVKHFLLHVCELHARSTEILNDTEGIVGWVSLDRIEAMRGEIIPSDLLIIKEMVLRPGSPCYECVLEKSGSEHRLKRFSPAAARLYRGSRR